MRSFCGSALMVFLAVVGPGVARAQPIAEPPGDEGPTSPVPTPDAAPAPVEEPPLPPAGPPVADPAPTMARVQIPQPTAEEVDREEVHAALAALQALHVSGYIQAQYEVHDDSENELDDDGGLLNLDRFRVRRGRLKFEYTGIEHALFMLQLDATSEAVSLRDAIAAISEPWTGWNVELAAGLFKTPFGFEVPQSSGDRVFPERSLLARTLFPGERDLGVRLKGKRDMFNFMLALVNGEPIGERTFPGRDPNSYKDFVGRLGIDTSLVDGGVSGYFGTEFVPGSPAVPGASSWFDEDGDGDVDPDEVTTTDPEAAVPRANAFRYRLGADVEFATELPGFGKLELLAEVALAHRAGVRGGDDVDQLLGYVGAIQHFRDLFGVALRFDWRDPNLDGDDDQLYTIEPVLLIYPVPAVRVSLAYDIVLEQGTSAGNNLFTARMQVKF